MLIRPMTMEDYEAVYALWTSLPGIGLHEHEDSYDGIAYYLRRNPGTCFVAVEEGEIIGVALCGNDGRRGYFNHLAVAADHQGKGIGRTLVNECLAVLRNEGIRKCSFLTFRTNKTANAFWSAIGSREREELLYWNLDTMHAPDPGAERP